MATQSNPEFERFNATMDQLLSVPHDELKRRMEEYKRESDKNPRKRGPKPRTTKKRPSSVYPVNN